MIVEKIVVSLRIFFGGYEVLDVFDCVSAGNRPKELAADFLRQQIDLSERQTYERFRPADTSQIQPCSFEANSFNFSPSTEYLVAVDASDDNIEKDSKNPTKVDEFAGSLYLIGGSANTTFADMIKRAGTDPKIAVVGRASSLPGYDEYLADGFVKAGIKPENITIIVPKDLVPEDPNYKHSYEIPADIDLVYFGGGSQEKLRKEFDDHQLEDIKKLLVKGAIVGGNSAGTAVMSSIMINGGDENKILQYKGF